MKKVKTLIFFILLLPIFTQHCFAEELLDKAVQITGIEEIEKFLPESAEDISGSLEDDGTYDAGGALKRLWTRIRESAIDTLQQNINGVVSLLAVSVFSSVAGSFIQDKNIIYYINIAGVCAAASLLAGDMDGLVSQTTGALNQMADYSRAVLPAVFTVAGSCGAFVSASARYAAVSVAIDVLMSMARGVLIPLIYAYIALSLSGSLFENALVKACQRAVKWISGTLLTGFTLAFSAYIGITGIVTGSADALAVKTARTVISTALPVVGGIISDTASTVLSAAGMIKNSAGVLSLVAVCALCAGPFVILSVKMLLFKITAAACDMLPNLRMSAFINDVGTALSMLLGLLGCCTILLFISFLAAIRVVVN